jgi:hypothetical protein
MNIKTSEAFKAAKNGFGKHIQPFGVHFAQFLPLDGFY